MALGMGFFAAPAGIPTAEDAEGSRSLPETDFARGAASRLGWVDVLLLPKPAPVSSVVDNFFFRSARATASASQAAFNRPRVAGRLLVHSAESASPAIWAIVRPVSTEVSSFSMS